MAFSWSLASGTLLAASLSGTAKKLLVGSGATYGDRLSILPPKMVHHLAASDRAQPSPKTAARLILLKIVNVGCHRTKYVLANIGAILSRDVVAATPAEDQMAIDICQSPPSCIISGLHTIQQAGRCGTHRAAANVREFCHDGKALV